MEKRFARPWEKSCRSPSSLSTAQRKFPLLMNNASMRMRSSTPNMASGGRTGKTAPACKMAHIQEASLKTISISKLKQIFYSKHIQHNLYICASFLTASSRAGPTSYYVVAVLPFTFFLLDFTMFCNNLDKMISP